MLQQDYNKLLQFTTAYVKHKHHLDANDIVNDVVLELLSSGKEITYIDAERMIKKHPSINERTEKQLGKDFGKTETQRVCKDCKEVLPVGAFYILKQKDRLVLSAYCKECHNKRCDKNRKKPEKWDEVKQRSSKANRENYSKQREYLSDEYIIRRILSNSWKKIKKGLVTREQVKESITKKVISEFRKKIIDRQNAENKASKQAA